MAIEKKPFVKYDLEEKKKSDIISIRLNDDERRIIEDAKKRIEQPKDATAIKTLAIIGYKSMTSELNDYILQTAFKNKRNNERLGISEFE